VPELRWRLVSRSLGPAPSSRSLRYQRTVCGKSRGAYRPSGLRRYRLGGDRRPEMMISNSIMNSILRRNDGQDTALFYLFAFAVTCGNGRDKIASVFCTF
jgi:hypothetical protein